VIVVCLAPAGCRGDSAPNRPAVAANSAEDAPRASAPAAGVAVAKSEAGASAASGAATAIAADAQAGLAVAPVLDRARGARAIRAYNAFHTRLCRALGDAGAAAAKLKEDVGLAVDTDELMFCPGPASGVQAIASGSFVQPDADEVLLQVPSGQARAEGEYALALARAEGAQYRIIRHTILNNGFDAKERIASPDGRDVLMLCSRSGSQGIYASVCGFWGQGTFAQGSDGDEADDPNEIPLVAVTACGPAVAEELGDIVLQGDRLSVVVVMRKSVRKPSTPDEASANECTNETQKSEKRFTLTYEIAAVPAKGKPRVRLVTPVPREIREIAKRY
jgi:hypothetical protein